jgi:two-component system response regulator DesR
MIRVLIAEDQAMVLGALAALLELEGDIEVVAQAADGAQALSLAVETQPDVVLTDIEMPKLTGIELAQEVRKRCLNARVIILTTFARGGYLRRALEAGASGYLLKDAPAGPARPCGRPGGRPGTGRRGLGRKGPAHRPRAAGLALGRRGLIKR